MLQPKVLQGQNHFQIRDELSQALQQFGLAIPQEDLDYMNMERGCKINSRGDRVPYNLFSLFSYQIFHNIFFTLHTF